MIACQPVTGEQSVRDTSVRVSRSNYNLSHMKTVDDREADDRISGRCGW
jgi:hypothetical protein